MQHMVMSALDHSNGIDLYIVQVVYGVARTRQTAPVVPGAQETLCSEGKTPQAGDILWTTYFYPGQVIRSPT